MSRQLRLFPMAIVLVVSLASCSSPRDYASEPPGMDKLHHIIIIVQENRSFDNYFGTYPGADGIPMKRGTPVVCVPIRFGAGVSVRFTTLKILTSVGRTERRTSLPT